MGGGNRQKQGLFAKARGSKGFSFTISMLIICITLIAMAAFSKEWGKGQQSSFTDVLPANEALRVLDRISADMANMLGASASANWVNSTTAQVAISIKFPFKDEGLPIADMRDYSRGLSASLGAIGLEAVLSAENLSNSSPTVMQIGGSGTVSLSNDGPNDTAVFTYPPAWNLAGAAVKISCDKAASSVGQFLPNGAAPLGSHPIRLEYYDSGGAYFRTANVSTSDVYLSIAYLDGATLVLKYANGVFSFSSTKSPGAYLVLPFDQNASNSSGAVRDYSAFRNNMTLGAADAPIWAPSGKYGGAYQFDGAGSNITISAFSLTETKPTNGEQGIFWPDGPG